MRAIYARHVAIGFGSFEETDPDLADFERRFEAVRAHRLPWLVAEADHRVLGYGYASAYRPRTGYRYTAEDSIYVAEAHTGRGVGRALLKGVIDGCAGLGLRQLVAMIGDRGNDASIGLHRACGFEVAGVLRSVGFKHRRWADVVVMQRALGAGDSSDPEGPGWS
jgi:phosphinothricin acetyltransferase